jgi:hypothetical protein
MSSMKNHEVPSQAPVQLSEDSIEITAADIKAIDRDVPAPEHTAGRRAVESQVDEMDAAEEVFDRSRFIEYWYFKCTSCGRKIFAGSYDAGPVADEAGTAKESVECTCVPDKAKVKPYKGRNGEDLFIHGEMKLHHYKAPRAPKVG